MKYEYIVSQNNRKDDHYYAGSSPTLEFVIKTDDYLLFMTINDTSGLSPPYTKYDYTKLRISYSNIKELGFTGKWRITGNDEDKSKTILYTEVAQEYILHTKNKVVEKVKETGWRRLFNKYKELITWEDNDDEIVKSTAWISENSFEFVCLYENKCENYEEVLCILE